MRDGHGPARRDPELALLVACAAWPPSPARVAAVQARSTGIDPARLGRVIARHRMAGMAANGLAAAGVPLPPGLVDAARADLLGAMRIAAEAARLVALFAGDGVAAVVLKGPPLAMAIYGTLAVRQLRDLDLLVAPGDLPRAMAAMVRQGYASRYPGTDAGLRPDRSAIFKDVEFFHPGTGLLVELHARLSENDLLLPVSALGPAQPVAIAPGLVLPAPAAEASLLYLMMHGFRHGWHRLKWLADVAAIVAGMEAGDVAALRADARARGMGVVVDATLLMLRDAMAMPLPPGLLAAARASRRARWCAAIALRHLSDERDAEDQVLLRALVVATGFVASTRPRYLLGEAGRLLVDHGIAIPLGGGRAARMLSVLLRPAMLPARKLARLHAARRRTGASTRISVDT